MVLRNHGPAYKRKLLESARKLAPALRVLGISTLLSGFVIAEQWAPRPPEQISSFSNKVGYRMGVIAGAFSAAHPLFPVEPERSLEDKSASMAKKEMPANAEERIPIRRIARDKISFADAFQVGMVNGSVPVINAQIKLGRAAKGSVRPMRPGF